MIPDSYALSGENSTDLWDALLCAKYPWLHKGQDELMAAAQDVVRILSECRHLPAKEGWKALMPALNRWRYEYGAILEMDAELARKEIARGRG